MNEIYDWVNWLARDKDGDIYGYEAKPKKLPSHGYWTNVCNQRSRKLYSIKQKMFTNVKWEDNEPTFFGSRIDVKKMKIEKLDEAPSHINFNSNKILQKTKSSSDQENVKKIETIDVIKLMLTEEEFIGYIKGTILEDRENAKNNGVEENYKKTKEFFDILNKLQ